MKLKTFYLAIFCIISVNCFSQLRVKKDGSVKIGSFKSRYGFPGDTSVFKLNVDGSICCTDNWLNLDVNQKLEIRPIDSPLDKLLKMNGKTFIPADQKTPGLHYGFNAREVKEEFPGLVRESGDPSKTLAINYDGFIPLLVEALKEQQNTINDLKEKVTALSCRKQNDINNNQAKDVHFTVRINLRFPDNHSYGSKVNDSDSAYYDQAILKLPATYSDTGIPTRLVYYAHGAGSSKDGMVTANSWFPENNTLIDDSLLANGYAIFDVNGGPIIENMGGSWVIQSVYKAYEYIQQQYNVNREIFVIGLSMGGLSSTNFVSKHSSIVLAQGMFCPVLDLYGQAWKDPWYSTTKKSIAQVYNFSDLSGSVWEPDKVKGWNPLYVNTFYNEKDTFKIYPVPVKIWHAADDRTVNISGSLNFQKYVQNANGFCELRVISDGGHGLSKGNPNMIRELILFLRRFDK